MSLRQGGVGREKGLERGGRALVIDDHPLSREGVSLAARAAMPGVAIVGVGTIAEGVAALATKPMFRLVLLDFHLPDARGFSGLLALQHVAPAVPIVIVTASEDPSLVEAATALGAHGFLFKTISLDSMVARLRDVLAGSTSFPMPAGEHAGTGSLPCARVSTSSRVRSARY